MNPVQQTVNTTTMGPTSTTKKKNISIVVLYIQGLGEKFKRTCNKKGIQVLFKGSNTIKHYLGTQGQDTNYRKVGSYTNTGAHKLTALRSILERLAEHLGTDLKII